MFKVNDYVVYKKDVCMVTEIKEIKDVSYYTLVPVEDKSLKISLPTSTTLIRGIISKDKALEVIKLIPDAPIIKEKNDKLLEQEYNRLLKTGDYTDLISIIKTTYQRNQYRLNEKKKIGEIDNRYFQIAERKLYDELAVALNMTNEEVKDYIFNEINNKK